MSDVSAPPKPENLVAALDFLEADGLVAFPTETVWGLAARATSQRAVERLQSFKGRAPDQPISVLVDALTTVESLGIALEPRVRSIAAAFWPGPLTLVIPGPAEGRLAAGIGGPTGAVGFRCSDHPVANLLVREAICRGLGPLTATSFNRSAETPVQTHAEAILLATSQGGDRVVVLRANENDASGGTPSTVLDLTTPEPRVLRAGAIDEAALAKVLVKLH